MVKNGQTFETFIKYQQKMRGKDAKGNKLFQAQSVKELNDDDDDDASIERDEKDKVLKIKLLVKQRRPAARDGHTGLVFTYNEKPYMFVFGGDRH